MRLDHCSRRDFLNGVLLGAATLGCAPASFAQGRSPDYPPADTGLVGQTERARERLHALRDGARPENVVASDEVYDLVVVGAGLSGLASALLYQRYCGRDASILLVDPLDDFGGHAKRNEFAMPDGRLVIGYGGSQSLDSPSTWSPAARHVLDLAGVELPRFESWFDTEWRQRHGVSGTAVCFDARHWPKSALAIRHESDLAHRWIADTALSPPAQRDLRRLLLGRERPLRDLPRAFAIEHLAQISYDRFLTEVWRLGPELPRYFAAATRAYLGVGTDAATALDAWALGLPGFNGLGLDRGELPAELSPSARQSMVSPDQYIHHFPDGNAGVARGLLRALCPAALPGRDMEDLVRSRCDYAALDLAAAPVRVRLRTAALRVEHTADGAGVRVICQSRDGAPYSVCAGQVVLACWSRVIPALCPELEASRADALSDQQKVPLLYANALLRDWRAFQRGGFGAVRNPGGFWDEASLDFPVSTRDYACAQSPDDPILVHFGRVMVDGGGASARDQAVVGRRRLESLPFLAIEGEMRGLLQAALGGFGFEHERDVLAVTVNRWAHGYAYEYMRPWDAYWPDGPLPCTAARRGWGRIAIANSDAGAFAYAHSAFDQAARAVAELLPSAPLPSYAARPGPYRISMTQ